MITIEPVMEFDQEVMLEWVEMIRPRLVWLGFDSKKAGLPEPSLEAVKSLHWEIARRGHVVILKKMREGRTEK